MLKKYYYLIILLIIYLKLENAITIRSIAFSYTQENSFSSLIDQFNKHSKENNLDIEVKIELFTPANYSAEISDYGALIDSILRKKNKKFDLIFYDHAYTTRYGPYLLNLENRLPKDHIKMYESGIGSYICRFSDNWVSL
eukprot:jgi/Orpsp1_1/1176620/evm.model.c7180000058342.1